MRSNTITPLLKTCIVHALLLLLEEKELDAISVTEIVARAGVNRSTYYRHFSSKADVARYFYAVRLDEYLETLPAAPEPEAYFTGRFESFLRYKRELLLLHRRELSYLLLEEMNARVPPPPDPARGDAVSLYGSYHIGGVFNSFLYWLRGEMAIPPVRLARLCVEMLPADFQPQLLLPAQTKEEEDGPLPHH